MCGIVGYIGEAQSSEILVEGLRRLEYRGYDSAGIATIDDGTVHVRRCVGKLRQLERSLLAEPVPGTIGIGHTRWATHGKPSPENAHPHEVDGVLVVHNGIIENYAELKRELAAHGRKFASETDTEIFSHLIALAMTGGMDLVSAVRDTLGRIRGAYAIAVLARAEPDKIVVAKNASPMVIGLGKGCNFVASDVPAIIDHTREIVFVDEGEMGVLTRDGVKLSTLDGKLVERAPKHIEWTPVQAQKGGFKHFMAKEIHEQPRAVADTLRARLRRDSGTVDLGPATLPLDYVRELERVVIVACGTSWHAGLTGKYVIERLARVPVEVDYAHEFRYRDPILNERTLLVAISQSGETADTLAAVKEARARGCKVLTVCNVVDSSIPRSSDWTLYTYSGPEIGVASTKTYLATMVCLYLLGLDLGRRRGVLGDAAFGDAVDRLAELPQAVEDALQCEASVIEVARHYQHYANFLFLGRGASYPAALEGALKLKEISYVHAEGYAAGEMKHGPIALIDEHMPVVVLAVQDETYEKLRSNLVEARSRSGKVIVVCKKGDGIRELADHVIEVPAVDDLVMPVVVAVPLQLLAYHIADIRGTDVDQPRNLAKSVTVE